MKSPIFQNFSIMLCFLNTEPWIWTRIGCCTCFTFLIHSILLPFRIPSPLTAVRIQKQENDSLKLHNTNITGRRYSAELWKSKNFSLQALLFYFYNLGRNATSTDFFFFIIDDIGVICTCWIDHRGSKSTAPPSQNISLIFFSLNVLLVSDWHMVLIANISRKMVVQFNLAVLEYSACA